MKADIQTTKYITINGRFKFKQTTTVNKNPTTRIQNGLQQ